MFARLSALPQARQDECWQAIAQLPQAFGQPHVHSGISIRKLTRRAYEFRAHLDLRFIFLDQPDGLYVRFLGNHDEVRREIKSGKYDRHWVAGVTSRNR